MAVIMAALAVTAPRAQTPSGPVLIIAPHPDDETLGCGGLIARRAHEGRRVVVVVLTDGRALLKRFGIDSDPTPAEVSLMRKEETLRAVELLGAKSGDVRFLDFENERLVEDQARATAELAAVLRELTPSEVYVTSPFEGHAEHIAANEMAREACRTTGACPSIFEYIVNLKRGVDLNTVPRRIVKVDVSAHREREHEALQQFRSHLGVISPKLAKPLDESYDRYLTAEETFLVEP
jgi:LmbE family N-acetylglucosaminyl deacetylase